MEKTPISNIQIIEIQKGNTLNQKPRETEWDKMSETMKQLVDLFFLERSIFVSKKPLDTLKEYIKEYDRLLYTVLSDAIYESFIKNEEKEALILGNIDYLLDLCNKDIEESLTLNNKNELKSKKYVRKVVLKIKDHINLAIRQYRTLKQTDEEYNRKFNEQIGAFKEKLTQDITSQLITLVGIFTAIAFVVFLTNSFDLEANSFRSTFFVNSPTFDKESLKSLLRSAIVFLLYFVIFLLVFFLMIQFFLDYVS